MNGGAPSKCAAVAESTVSASKKALASSVVPGLKPPPASRVWLNGTSVLKLSVAFFSVT